MATDRNVVEERRNGSTNNPFGGDIITARIVANYGDPGLTENYMFDILSRFLIVMLTPTQRIPQYGNYPTMFALVKRPEHLWIDVDGGVQSNIDNQRRSDYEGNINKGNPEDGFILDNIPQINRQYKLGETIKCKKLDATINFEDTFFTSLYDATTYLGDATKNKYNENYLTKDPVGSAASVSNNATRYASAKTYPLYDGAGVRDYMLRGVSYTNGVNQYSPNYSTVSQSGTPTTSVAPTFDSNYQYAVGLNKYTFEVFWRYIAENLAATDSVILRTSAIYDKFARTKGPYLWDANVNPTSIGLFSSCAYEDMNIDGKTRSEANECLPLVVTNPSQFPVPKTKEVGSIKFDPTFQSIVAS